MEKVGIGGLRSAQFPTSSEVEDGVEAGLARKMRKFRERDRELDEVSVAFGVMAAATSLEPAGVTLSLVGASGKDGGSALALHDSMLKRMTRGEHDADSDTSVCLMSADELQARVMRTSGERRSVDARSGAGELLLRATLDMAGAGGQDVERGLVPDARMQATCEQPSGEADGDASVRPMGSGKVLHAATQGGLGAAGKGSGYGPGLHHDVQPHNVAPAHGATGDLSGIAQESAIDQSFAASGAMSLHEVAARETARSVAGDSIPWPLSAMVDAKHRPSAPVETRSAYRPFRHRQNPTLELEPHAPFVYRFRTWGADRSVRITAHAPGPGVETQLILQPSDPVVQQRLGAHWPSGELPQQWSLQRDHDQRGERQQQADEGEGDET
ncbi:type III secretion system needle length determinant, SpaN/EivJ family [Burkholderia ubonensis]|uniref:SpaN/EivJ family type III secretion system needle length determinant n=1 Tax=Burkholderia ubonensis TaxID=101571 RepID=UPI0009B30DB1|nr:type III secretion system needle length determinant, SpaN/EivJ family [Burkholderia ubonensis]